MTYNHSPHSSDPTPPGPRPPAKFPSSLPEDLTQDDPRSYLEARGKHILIFQEKIMMEMGSTVFCGQTMQGKGYSCDAVGCVCLAMSHLTAT